MTKVSLAHLQALDALTPGQHAALDALVALERKQAVQRMSSSIGVAATLPVGVAWVLFSGVLVRAQALSHGVELSWALSLLGGQLIVALLHALIGGLIYSAVVTATQGPPTNNPY